MAAEDVSFTTTHIKTIFCRSPEQQFEESSPAGKAARKGGAKSSGKGSGKGSGKAAGTASKKYVSLVVT